MDSKRRTLFLAFVAGILLGCKRQPSPTVFADPALAVLVPQDTTFLAGVRMQQIEAGSFHAQEPSRAPRLLKFRAQIGLPDDTDVWEYLIASNGSNWVGLMRGKFAEMGMEPRLKNPSAKRTSFEGIPVLGDEKGAVGFLNPTTAVAGKLDAVLRTLERRNNNTGIPDALEKLRSHIPSTNQVWFVSTGPLPDMFPVATASSARGGFDTQSHTIDIVVDAESESAARAIAASIGGRVEQNRAIAKGLIPRALLDSLLGK